MLSSKSYFNDSIPERLYFDITMSNIASTNTIPPLIYFQEERNMPFIISPQEYYMSVQRFTIDTQLLPIFLPLIQPTQANPNLTIYSITMTYLYNGVNYQHQQFINWIAQDTSAPIPLGPSLNGNKQEINSDYYFCYSHQYVIELMNTCVSVCYTSLQALVVAAGGVLPSNYAPVFNFDTTNNICIINADNLGYANSLNNPIKMYMNGPLYQLFSSFQAQINGYTNITNGKNYQIIIDNFDGSSITPFPSLNPLFNAINVYQEYATVSNWCPIVSLCFLSYVLPIVNEQISAPLIFNNGQTALVNTGNNSAIASIITDFAAGDNKYKPFLTYTPTSEFRRIQLTGNSPLRKIDLAVFWRTRLGDLVPMRIASGGTITIKLLFERKDTLFYKPK